MERSRSWSLYVAYGPAVGRAAEGVRTGGRRCAGECRHRGGCSDRRTGSDAAGRRAVSRLWCCRRCARLGSAPDAVGSGDGQSPELPHHAPRRPCQPAPGYRDSPCCQPPRTIPTRPGCWPTVAISQPSATRGTIGAAPQAGDQVGPRCGSALTPDRVEQRVVASLAAGSTATTAELSTITPLRVVAEDLLPLRLGQLTARSAGPSGAGRELEPAAEKRSKPQPRSG